MSDLGSDVESAMQSLGIDSATVDDGSLDPSEFNEAEASEETSPSDKEACEAELSSDTDEPLESLETTTEEEEKVEAPTEEPKLTLKEFQELNAKEQALAAREAKFNEDFAKKEQELEAQYGEKAREYDLFDSFLSTVAENRPELFDDLQAEMKEYQKHYANPQVDKVTREIAELKKELGQFKARASDEVTITKLDTQLKETMSTLGKEAESLGIKVDTKIIEDLWAKGFTTDEAFEAKYGAMLRKASLSRAKVEFAEKKVKASPSVSTAGNVKRSTQSTTADYGKMSWDQAAMHALKQVTGKAS